MISNAATDGLVLQRFTPPLRLADFGLIAFDMDSTLIDIECIDEIADAVGKKAEVAAITEATMRGEIKDFKESLTRRVALLEGVPVAALQRVHDERLHLNPGAEALVAACKAAGLKVLLVSGGFTFFADRVKARLGIDFARSNLLEEADGHLTGRVVPQCWGDICDGAEKRRLAAARRAHDRHERAAGHGEVGAQAERPGGQQEPVEAQALSHAPRCPGTGPTRAAA